MAGAFTKDQVEAVRSAGDLVRLISDYVPLKPAGARLKGLCPFHQEKTPSFSVDPNAQLFYCFGCNTGGDAFKFVMLYEKLDFPEAVEFLARRWGVALPAPSAPADDLKRRVLDMNRAAEQYYRQILADPGAGRQARDYVASRGIATETAEALRLGYAPDAWDALRGHLLGRRFRSEDLVKAGLAVPRKDGSGSYDRFRDRLIFPIRDVTGRPVAFGGRALGEAEPKYLNSPETPAYTKGEHLYGLDLAKEAIRREGFAVVVEGYLDLAAVRQAGIENVVASLGTAFTPYQAQLLARFTDRVVVSYDGDAAGASAAARSLDLLLERGFQVRVAELPAGLDPDDFVRREGAAAYEARVRQAPGYLEFLVNRETSSRDLARIEEKVAAVNALLPRLVKLPTTVERAEWAGRLADALHIEEDTVLQELRAALKAAQPRIRQRADEPGRLKPVEPKLVTLLLYDPAARARAAEEVQSEDLQGFQVTGIVETILNLERETGRVDPTSVYEALGSEEDRSLLTRIAFHGPADAGPGEIEDCLDAVRRERLKREGRELQRMIEKAADPAEEFLTRKIELARQRDALS